MTCPRCATALEAAARFCGVCGHRLGPGEGDASPRSPSEAEPKPRTETAPRAGAAKAAGGGGGKAAGPTRTNQPGPPSKIAVAPPAPAAPDPYIGTTLNGRFTIEKKLGEGGFGAVYNGTQLLTGRRVAIKLLHPEMTRDQNVVARFRREGQVLCSLRDAHTITTYDFDQTADGTLFIAMELLEGRSLHDIFHDEAPIAWQRMLKIIGEMCSSLEEAHSLGIVHRDLKPENIYLEARPGNPEFVKILDFGIAKVMRGDGSSGIAGDMSPQLTATGQTLGTLEYMSPEQLMGKPLDGRSDIYALGVVTFEMLTGRLPFPEAVGPAALISAQLKKVPPQASVIYPKGGIPAVVDQLILRMMAKDKNQRFRDMSDLRREVDGILATGGQPHAARTPSSAPPVREESSSALATIDERRPRTASSPSPGRQGPSMGTPHLSAGSAAVDAAHRPPRPVMDRPPVGPGPGASPAPRRPASEHNDPPWAGGAPYGSSDENSAAFERGPRGHHSPALTGSGPGPGPRGGFGDRGGGFDVGPSMPSRFPEHTPAEPPRAQAGSPPWMWIAVGAVLILAIAIGVFAAM